MPDFVQTLFQRQGREMVIDMFAGAGGASCGLEMAGIHVDAAINHDPEAVSLHKHNHPTAEHYVQDVYNLSPHIVTQGRHVGLLWMSPDCTHHSKAKGGAPIRDIRRRELARVLVDLWIPELGPKAPRVVILENVEEFADWGPLNREGRIVESAKGESFRAFINALRRYKYRVERRELRACDYGAPTIRKRLFLIARRDRLPIVWPAPTHGDPASAEVKSGKLLPWRTAAECIDFSLPCPSIFATSEEIKAQYGIRAIRPLADKTMERIAKGVVRYVLENPSPFIVTYYGQKSENEFRGLGLDQALPTQTTENRFAFVNPFLAHLNHSASYYRHFRGRNVQQPAPTITTSPGMALVSAFIAKHYGGVVGSAAGDPLATVTTRDHNALCAAFLRRDFGQSVGADCAKPAPTVMPGGLGNTSLGTAHLIKFKGDEFGAGCDAPAPTICTRNQAGLVAAFLAKYYGAGVGQCADTPMHTVTTNDRFGLVVVHIAGEPYVLTDIGMRMLTPRELARAQGFPDSYVLEVNSEGREVSRTSQVRGIGNSVSPHMARALGGGNYQPRTFELPTVDDLPLLKHLSVPKLAGAWA